MTSLDIEDFFASRSTVQHKLNPGTQVMTLPLEIVHLIAEAALNDAFDVYYHAPHDRDARMRALNRYLDLVTTLVDVWPRSKHFVKTHFTHQDAVFEARLALLEAHRRREILASNADSMRERRVWLGKHYLYWKVMGQSIQIKLAAADERMRVEGRCT